MGRAPQYGNTPLMRAAAVNQLGAVQELLAKGADIEVKDQVREGGGCMIGAVLCVSMCTSISMYVHRTIFVCVRVCERTGDWHPRCKGVREKDGNLSGTRVGNEACARERRVEGDVCVSYLSHFEGRFAGKRGVGGGWFGVGLYNMVQGRA